MQASYPVGGFAKFGRCNERITELVSPTVTGCHPGVTIPAIPRPLTESPDLR